MCEGERESGGVLSVDRKRKVRKTGREWVMDIVVEAQTGGEKCGDFKLCSWSGGFAVSLASCWLHGAGWEQAGGLCNPSLTLHTHSQAISSWPFRPMELLAWSIVLSEGGKVRSVIV